MEVVASLSQGRTAAAQCGLFTHQSVPVIFEPPCIMESLGNSLEKPHYKGYVVVLFECRNQLMEDTRVHRGNVIVVPGIGDKLCDKTKDI